MGRVYILRAARSYRRKPAGLKVKSILLKHPVCSILSVFETEYNYYFVCWPASVFVITAVIDRRNADYFRAVGSPVVGQPSSVSLPGRVHLRGHGTGKRQVVRRHCVQKQRKLGGRPIGHRTGQTFGFNGCKYIYSVYILVIYIYNLTNPNV